jgi:hypothetical protein
MAVGNLNLKTTTTTTVNGTDSNVTFYLKYTYMGNILLLCGT